MNHYFYDFELYQSPSSDNAEVNLEGDNEKNLLVVVKESDFSEDNRAFLTKILSAVHFEIQRDAAILVLPKDANWAVNEIMHSEKFAKCLIFGIAPKALGFSIESFLYAPFEIAKKSFLLGNDLEKIKNSTEYKKLLWASLQAIFPVK